MERARTNLLALQQRQRRSVTRRNAKDIEADRRLMEEELYQQKMAENPGALEALESAEVRTDVRKNPLVAGLLEGVGRQAEARAAHGRARGHA